MSADPRVVIVDGYGVSLSVSRGQLVIKDGVGRYRRERRVSRIDAKGRNGLARIIIQAETGHIALDVFKWCDELSIPVINVSLYGKVSFCSPGLISTDARMYKQQILAQPGMAGEKTGLELVREFLTAKIAGQVEILKAMGAESTRLQDRLMSIAPVRSIREMQGAEGNAAKAYWEEWQTRVFVPWEIDDLRYIPGHWSQFNGRAGVITKDNGYAASSNSKATDFINACLNYAYKICETEAMYACYTVGLHPALGLSHGEIHDNKPGMALDLIEPLRPIADQVVLSYLDCGKGFPYDENGKPAYITRECAYELEDSTCRLSPPMTTRLASAVSMAVAPHAIQWAEHVAKQLVNTKKMTIVTGFDPRIRERSKEPLTLSGDITVENLVPDHIWEKIKHVIPERRNRPSNAADIRTLLAVNIAHERYGIAWKTAASPFRVNRETCQLRLKEWRETGVWDAIMTEFTKPGISQQQQIS
jgi:CRISPR-associated endonuclease Cas1